jgi:hypothetical protein
VRVLDRQRLNNDQRNSFIAALLGWTMDAFDYFLVVLVYADIAKTFHHTKTEVAADKYTRRLPVLRGKFSAPFAGLTASRLAFTASARMPERTPWARSTVVAPLPLRTMPAIHASIPSWSMSATPTAAQCG